MKNRNSSAEAKSVGKNRFDRRVLSALTRLLGATGRVKENRSGVCC